MYDWRRMSGEEQRDALKLRQQLRLPKHGPGHRRSYGSGQWMFTGACYEHRDHIGRSPDRMAEFEGGLLETVGGCCEEVAAWVVLPNHSHVLAQTSDVRGVVAALGALHGRTSFQWNGEEETRGRKVWFRCAETVMKSDHHFWATMNYIHHNPVKHRYVGKWTEWPFSSAANFLEQAGHDEAASIWKNYPIKEYGAGWDD